MKWESPARKILHFMTAHEMARSSSSMMAYRDSAPVRKRDPAWTRAHVKSGCSCWRMNPRPCLLVSVLNLVFLLESKNASVGAVVRATFV